MGSLNRSFLNDLHVWLVQVILLLALKSRYKYRCFYLAPLIRFTKNQISFSHSKTPPPNWTQFKDEFVKYFANFEYEKTDEVLSMTYESGDINQYMIKKMNLLKYVFPEMDEGALMK